MSMQTEKPKSNVLRNCLVIGCLMAFLAAGCVVAGSYWFYKKVADAVSTDPAKVEAIAQKMLPGARPPAGYKALFGGDLFGFQGAFFGPPHGGDARPGEAEFMIMRLPQSNDLNIEKLREDFKSGSGQRGSSDQKVLSEEKVTLEVGGKPIQAAHVVVEEDGAKKDQVVTLFLDKEKHLIIVLAMGPSEKFADAPVQSFFEGLDISNLEAMDPEQVKVEAEPTPAESPAEEE